MNCDVILYKNPNIVSKLIDNDYILIPIVEETMDMNNIYGISEVGAFIWDNIDGETTINDLIKKVVSEYEIEKKIAVNDINDFITDCVNNKILLKQNFGKQ